MLKEKQNEVKLAIDTGDTLKGASLIMLSDYCARTSFYKDRENDKFTMFKQQWDAQNKKNPIDKVRLLERSDNFDLEDLVEIGRRVSLEF